MQSVLAEYTCRVYLQGIHVRWQSLPGPELLCWASAAAVGGRTSAKAETGASGSWDALIIVAVCLLAADLRCCNHLHTCTDMTESTPGACSRAVLKQCVAVRIPASAKAENGACGGCDECQCHWLQLVHACPVQLLAVNGAVALIGCLIATTCLGPTASTRGLKPAWE